MHIIDMQGNEYRNNKFIIGLDCEQILGLAFTGMNTKTSLMMVRLKTAEFNRGNRIQILLRSEQLLEVNDTGVSVYD